MLLTIFSILLFGILLNSTIVFADNDNGNNGDNPGLRNNISANNNSDDDEDDDLDDANKTRRREEIKQAIQERNRINFENRTGVECPENCTCTGVVVKCELEDGSREMTIYAGSGNIIVQVKGINATTQVTLYHHNKTIYGVFKNNETKEVIGPDQAKEKVRNRIKAKIELENLNLTEEGYYEITIGKKSRLFYIIPVKEKVQARLLAENGEIVRVRNPWWGFLARDVSDDNESE